MRSLALRSGPVAVSNRKSGYASSSGGRPRRPLIFVACSASSWRVTAVAKVSVPMRARSIRAHADGRPRFARLASDQRGESASRPGSAHTNFIVSASVNGPTSSGPNRASPGSANSHLDVPISRLRPGFCPHAISIAVRVGSAVELCCFAGYLARPDSESKTSRGPRVARR